MKTHWKGMKAQSSAKDSAEGKERSKDGIKYKLKK